MAAKKKAGRSGKSRTNSTPAQRPAVAPEEAVPSSSAAREETTPGRGPPVAGIGASAGGLDAFKKFFSAMPADSGIALVLVPHLDPKHESLMVELVARYTRMPVVEAAEGMAVEANHVYVIPPNKYMTIARNALRLTGPVERGGPQTSIDLFLRSLADDKQEKAVCVILSGTGAHGTLGLKAVKAAGGMAMVQDPATAEYPRMPQSAVATGLADYVLAPEQMPQALGKYVRHFYVNGGVAVKDAGEAPDGLKQVLALLRARTKFDFRWYRKRMLARRIERRMGLYHFDDVGDYLAHLRGHPDEVKQLARDLFISVTSFFRDAEAFQALEAEVIVPLSEAKEADASLRVWVPGCATGEEPYSIAIILLERLAVAQKSHRVQIFATDVDREALEVGRLGVYPESILADVSPERLARYFTRDDESSYKIGKQIRELIMFAAHNVLADAPFSKLDLISCRNLLIYLEPEAQQKLLTLFHFALNEGGYLFLGPSETIGHETDLFDTVSKKWRIFRRIGRSRPARVEFPIATSLDQPASRQVGEPGPARGSDLSRLAHRLILEQLGTAAVLVNRKYEVLFFFGPTDRYLELPPGEPTRDLNLMLREGLRSRLRAAVHKALREVGTVVVDDVQVKRDGTYVPAIVRIAPVHDPRSGKALLLLTFQDRPDAASAPAAAHSEDSMARQLEYELRATKEDLQSTIEEMESASEELKAANEEVMSMNEELQSANEELESSKEELQSLNEELTTVNTQLQEKVEELEAANNDVANLLDSTDVATVFLDSALRIKRFTPAATKLFRFIAADVGRPLDDVASRVNDLDLLADAQEVLQHLAPREKEVATADRWWLRRITPYRTRDNRISGVVITVVDVSESRRADEAAHRLAAVVENSADAIYANALDGAIQTWNQGAVRLYGYTRKEALGSSIRRIVPEDRMQEWSHVMARLARGEHIEQFDTERIGKEGRRIPVSLTYSPLCDANGRVTGASVIARNMTERRLAEDALRREQELAESIINTAPSAILLLDSNGRILRFNPFLEQLTGRRLADVQGRDWFDTFLPERDRDAIRTLFAQATAGKPTLGNVNPIVTADGRERDIEWYDARIRGADGKTECLVCIGHDITDRKRAVQELRESEQRLQLMADALPVLISYVDADCRYQFTNARYEDWFGLPRDAYKGRHLRQMLGEAAYAAIKEHVEAVLAGQPRTFEACLPYQTAGTRDVLVSYVPHRNQDGRVVGYYALILDLSERKKAEEALRASEERLRAILNTAADAIITIDQTGTVQSVNAAAERMFGYAAAEMIGQNVRMLMPAPYQGEHDRYLTRYLQTGEKRIIGIGREVEGRRKDGSTLPVDLAISEVGHLKLFTGIIRDITHRQELEREVLEIAAQEQRRIGQELHDDVGQRLTGLGMLADALAQQLARDDSQRQEAAARIAAELGRVREQARSLALGLVPVDVDAGGLQAALEGLAAHTRELTGVICTLDSPEPVTFRDTITATHLFRIAQEAVHNALRHGKARRIELSLVRQNNQLVLTVGDDGTGIAQPLDETKGLGIRLMQNRASLIGGRLEIGPATGGGTHVTCLLPWRESTP